MLDAPFFGRVDFVFEDEEETQAFYIGIGNFGAEDITWTRQGKMQRRYKNIFKTN